MPAATPIHKSPLTGKMVSTRAASHDPACSAAASAWRLRKATKDTFIQLAACRRKAAAHRGRGLRESAGKIAPGRETPLRHERAASLKAQHAAKVAKATKAAPPAHAEAHRRLEYDAQTVARMPEGLGKRLAQAAIEDRRKRLGLGETPAPAPSAPAPAPSFSLRPANAGKPSAPSLFGKPEGPAPTIGGQSPAPKPAPSPAKPEPEPAPAPFSLKQESSAGRKAAPGFFGTATRQGKLLDVKKGDLPGQTSLLEQVPSVETHPQPKADPLANVPESVRSHVRGALRSIRERVEAQRRAAGLARNPLVGGERRYLDEVREKEAAGARKDAADVREFRRLAKENGVDPKAAVGALASEAGIARPKGDMLEGLRSTKPANAREILARAKGTPPAAPATEPAPAPAKAEGRGTPERLDQAKDRRVARESLHRGRILAASGDFAHRNPGLGARPGDDVAHLDNRSLHGRVIARDPADPERLIVRRPDGYTFKANQGTLGLPRPRMEGRHTPERLARAQELREGRAAKPASPQAPSPKDQAAAARAKKGDAESRRLALMARITRKQLGLVNDRVGNLKKPPAERDAAEARIAARGKVLEERKERLRAGDETPATAREGGKPKAPSRSTPQRDAAAAKLRAFRNLSPAEKAAHHEAAIRRHEDRMAAQLKTPQAAQSAIDDIRRSVANGLKYDVSGHIESLERVKKRLTDEAIASDKPSPKPPATTSSELPGGTRPAMSPEQVSKAVAEVRAAKGLPPLEKSGVSPIGDARPAPKPPRTPDQRAEALARLAGKLQRHREKLAHKAATPGNPLHNRNVEVFGRGRQIAEAGRRVADRLGEHIRSKGGIPPAPAIPRPPIDRPAMDAIHAEIRALRAAPDAGRIAGLRERMGRTVNNWEAEHLARRALGVAAEKALPNDRGARLDAIASHLKSRLPAGAWEAHEQAAAAKKQAASDWQAKGRAAVEAGRARAHEDATKALDFGPAEPKAAAPASRPRALEPGGPPLFGSHYTEAAFRALNGMPPAPGHGPKKPLTQHRPRA